MLKPNALYLGDNGRCFCGSEKCAGMTAFYSGKDLSGRRLYRLSERDNAEGHAMSAEFRGFKCETCGKTLEAVAA